MIMAWRWGALAVVLAVSWCVPAGAQQFDRNTDPIPYLRQLISAFQVCGPPDVYQMLSPALFQVIAVQTGGMGCYPQIAAAGPIANMQRRDVQLLPAGPVFAVRVTHQNGAVADWFIGLSNWTGRVEYLTFVPAAANSASPTISAGPVRSDGSSGGSIPPPPPPQSQQQQGSGGSANSACTARWGTMCQ